MITAKDVLKRYNDLPRNSPRGLTEVIEEALAEARQEGNPPAKIVLVQTRKTLDAYCTQPVEIERVNLTSLDREANERADDRINSIEFREIYRYKTSI